MIRYKGSERERLTLENRQASCPANSGGYFKIRNDGTATFDRHHHTYGEFWFIAAGSGDVRVGDQLFHVTEGDIVFTPPGVDHDFELVEDELRVFWLSVSDTEPQHLSDSPSSRHLVKVRTHD